MDRGQVFLLDYNKIKQSIFESLYGSQKHLNTVAQNVQNKTLAQERDINIYRIGPRVLLHVL